MSEKTKKEEKTNIKNNKRNKINSIPTIILIILTAAFIFISVTFISDLMFERYEEQTLEEYCKTIENDPALSYPCNCYPFTDKEHVEIEIRDKIDNMCACECIIGPNQTIIIPVARAKD
ncbi:MAG: hypothetical protein KAJ47_01610 [Candidatus Aenigmarchaeota archaeon]|nr:hypothetical protein [Candidatus Aenigmarchaeota archaeon]